MVATDVHVSFCCLSTKALHIRYKLFLLNSFVTAGLPDRDLQVQYNKVTL